MKKNLLIIGVFVVNSMSLQAAPKMPIGQALDEELAFANQAYRAYDSGQSLGDRIKVRLPFAHTLLSKDNSARQLVDLRYRRNELQKALWQRQGKKRLEIFLRQHYPELLAALAGTAALAGGAYAVGKPVGRWRRKRDEQALRNKVLSRWGAKRWKGLVNKRKAIAHRTVFVEGKQRRSADSQPGLGKDVLARLGQPVTSRREQLLAGRGRTGNPRTPHTKTPSPGTVPA